MLLRKGWLGWLAFQQRPGGALIATNAVSERDAARGPKLQRIVVGLALAAAFAPCPRDP